MHHACGLQLTEHLQADQMHRCVQLHAEARFVMLSWVSQLLHAVRALQAAVQALRPLSNRSIGLQRALRVFWWLFPRSPLCACRKTWSAWAASCLRIVSLVRSCDLLSTCAAHPTAQSTAQGRMKSENGNVDCRRSVKCILRGLHAECRCWQDFDARDHSYADPGGIGQPHDPPMQHFC